MRPFERGSRKRSTVVDANAKGRELYDAWMAATNARESAERRLTDLECQFSTAKQTLELRIASEREARKAFNEAHEIADKDVKHG